MKSPSTRTTNLVLLVLALILAALCVLSVVRG